MSEPGTKNVLLRCKKILSLLRSKEIEHQIKPCPTDDPLDSNRELTNVTAVPAISKGGGGHETTELKAD